MEAITIHEKINFKSNFRPSNDTWYMRLLRPKHFPEMMNDFIEPYSKSVPFWSELAGYRTKKQRFNDKF